MILYWFYLYPITQYLLEFENVCQEIQSCSMNIVHEWFFVRNTFLNHCAIIWVLTKKLSSSFGFNCKCIFSAHINSNPFSFHWKFWPRWSAHNFARLMHFIGGRKNWNYVFKSLLGLQSEKSDFLNNRFIKNSENN